MATVYTIGIDFGTANSCVAYATYNETAPGTIDPTPLRRPEVIPFHNHDTVPTAIHLGDGTEHPPTFGRMAEEQGLADPMRLYTGFKLNLGHPEMGPDAFLMAKYFLSYLKRRVELFVPLGMEGADERVETVVGHPVQWSADQRETTLRAAQDAGFPNVRVEEESLGALYCHVFDERGGQMPEPGSYILTVDMGGGTTDFAFLHIPPDGSRPISIPVHPAPSEGRSYGGRDLDRLLLRYLSRGWPPEILKQYSPYLIREVRQFKEAFSSHLSEGAEYYDGKLTVGDEVQRIRLKRDEFEKITSDYIRYFEVLLRGAVDEAQLKPEQVTHIILTGGHSRWYFVENTIRGVFPHLAGRGRRNILRHSHPEQSVARGLAYDLLVRSGTRSLVAPVRRATHSVWLQIPRAGAQEDEQPVLLIPRGQQLPFRTSAPLKFNVEQIASDGSETTVRLRFLTGHRRTPLADRTATFQRGFWEQVSKSLAGFLRLGGQQQDRFQIEIQLSVDEHEIITAEMTVTRYVGNRAVDVQRQEMKVNLEREP